MILARHWEQCCSYQGQFGTIQRWLLWIVASVLQRVWWSFGRNIFFGFYWPANIKGDAIDTHFASKEVGNVDAVKQVEYGVAYRVFFMK